LTEAQPGDVLLCCFGSSVPNHAAIYCGDGELLHHIPEQLSKRERYTDKWQRRTHSLWRHRAWHPTSTPRALHHACLIIPASDPGAR
ncbi:NlpC/P60 family protein, partial [Escherichia coli]|nr:NlpC/P60 family protein [Escherichia coli]